jgi:hypothetical protein
LDSHLLYAGLGCSVLSGIQHLTAATLVVGVTFAATSAAFAFKKGQDNSKNGNTVTIQEEKQKASVSGFDNDLEQEAQSVICTHPGENATCTSESG